MEVGSLRNGGGEIRRHFCLVRPASGVIPDRNFFQVLRDGIVTNSDSAALQWCRGLGDETNFGNVHLLDNVEHADYVLVICVV